MIFNMVGTAQGGSWSLPAEFQRVAYILLDNNTMSLTSVIYNPANDDIISFIAEHPDCSSPHACGAVKLSSTGASQRTLIGCDQMKKRIYSSSDTIYDASDSSIYSNGATKLYDSVENDTPFEIAIRTSQSVTPPAIDPGSYTLYSVWFLMVGAYSASSSQGDDNFFKGGKIYSASVSRGGRKIIDLLPCYRKSDSVAGFYDLVGMRFYPAQYGTFTAGPNA